MRGPHSTAWAARVMPKLGTLRANAVRCKGVPLVSTAAGITLPEGIWRRAEIALWARNSHFTILLANVSQIGLYSNNAKL